MIVLKQKELIKILSKYDGDDDIAIFVDDDQSPISGGLYALSVDVLPVQNLEGKNINEIRLVLESSEWLGGRKE